MATIYRLAGAAALLLGSAASFGAVAQEQSFYSGKTVNIVVGFSPGGGYDAYGRLLAGHYGKHIPGKPQVVVQNMPGAASRRSVQYLDTNAPTDGTAIVIFNFGQITSSIVMPPQNMTLDFRRYAWIGSMNRDVSVCYVWKERYPGAKNAVELAKTGKQVIYGVTGVGSSSWFNQAMMKGVFEVNLKQVAGYPGSKDKQLAVERGELDGDCGEWSSVPQDWVAKGSVEFMMRSSNFTPEDMPKGIPWAVELAPTPEKKQMVRLLTAASDIGRPFITRREVPADRLAILRKAFNDAMKDPELIAESKKTARPISAMTAEEVMEALEELHAIPQDIVEKTKASLPTTAK